ncbi:MAG TPA: deoxyribonuclease IV [Mycobacteriales bacterium]|nr:deoxyribonuclease IV [Mycobacteriales bacterium]
MAPRKTSLIGVHVPVAGGLARSGLSYAREVGAEAVQVFVSNPRGWAQSGGDAAQDAAFVAGCRSAALPVFVHAPYLVNLGSPTPATVVKSVDALRHSVRRGRVLGARGVVVHAGSEVLGHSYDAAIRQVREHLLPLLDELDDDDPDVLIEMTAGAAGSLAASPERLGAYLDALDRHPRVGVCVDTCHAMAAGHDLAAPGGLRRFLAAIHRIVGRGRIRLVHANDSKDPVGSARDRHERIGAGSIGSEAFRELFVHPATRGVALVMETPGSVDEHRTDVDLLKRFRHEALAR